MKCKLLENAGLTNYISGKEMNFREGIPIRNLEENIKVIFNKMNINPKIVYLANQVHNDNIEYCNGENGYDYSIGKIHKSTDGLITDKSNIALIIKYADCTPVILFDPIRKVQCTIHSGWKSTVKKIAAIGIAKMINDFNCRKENILAYLGPSIDIENYEVGKEVYDAFSVFENRDEFFVKKKNNKYNLSVIDANYSLLIENGIKKENIEVSSISTYVSENLHSARRDGKDYGLNSIVSIIK